MHMQTNKHKAEYARQNLKLHTEIHIRSGGRPQQILSTKNVGLMNECKIRVSEDKFLGVTEVM